MRFVRAGSLLVALLVSGCSGGGSDSPGARTPDVLQQVSSTLPAVSGPIFDSRASGVLSDGHGLVAWTDHRDGAAWVTVVRRLPGGGMAAVGELGEGVLLGVGFGSDAAWLVWAGSPEAPGRGHPLRVVEFRAGTFGAVETIAELDVRPGSAVLVEGRRRGSWGLVLQGIGPGPAARLFERGAAGVWESRGSLGTLHEVTWPADAAIAFAEARLAAVDGGYVAVIDIRDARRRVVAGHWSFGEPVDALRPFDGEASAVVGLAAADGAAMLVGKVRASLRARRFVDGGWEPAEFVALADRAALTGWDDDVGRPAGFALLACERRSFGWNVDLIERSARAAGAWAARARLADLDDGAAEPELFATAEGVVAKWYDGGAPKVTVLDRRGITSRRVGTPIPGALLVRAAPGDASADWAVASTVDHSVAPPGILSVRLTVGRGREVVDEWLVPAEVRQADYRLAALAPTPDGVMLLSWGASDGFTRLEADEWQIGPSRSHSVLRGGSDGAALGPPEAVTAFALARDPVHDTVTLLSADPGNGTPRLMRRRLAGGVWAADEQISRTEAPIWLVGEAQRSPDEQGFLVGQGGGLGWYPQGATVPTSLAYSGLIGAGFGVDVATRGSEFVIAFVAWSDGSNAVWLRRLDGAERRFDVRPPLAAVGEGKFDPRVGIGGSATGLLFGDSSEVVVQRYDLSGGLIEESRHTAEPDEAIVDADLVMLADDRLGVAVHVEDRIELRAPPGLVDVVGPASPVRPAAPRFAELDGGLRMVWFDGPLLRTTLSTPQRTIADLLSDPATVARSPRVDVEPVTRIAWIEDLPAGGSRIVARTLELGVFTTPVEWLRRAQRIESFSTRRFADGQRVVVWQENGQLWSRRWSPDPPE